ncbi:MAG: TIGR02186 family protein [Alphaproteobacteria bacterium]
MRTSLRSVLTVMLALTALAGSAPAAQLAVDLSDHTVAISTGFAGTSLLLFGATEQDGDLVVVVTGPKHDVTVRRKSRVSGVWVNTESATFGGVPGFYAVAATRPLDQVTDEAARRRHEIGFENIALQRPLGVAPETVTAFRDGLRRNLVKAGLVVTETRAVEVIDERLFRTRIAMPSNVPIGTYLTRVMLFQDGELISVRTTHLRVERTGVGASVFEFAHNQSAIYGLVAIALALAAGWFAAIVFRR